MSDEDDELGDFETEPDDNEEQHEMMAEDDTDARGPEPVRDSDDYAEGRADAQSVGTKIRGKVKRGTETRDQDELVIEGRGVNAQEAADDFEQALTRAEEGDWAGRLRALRSSDPEPEE